MSKFKINDRVRVFDGYRNYRGLEGYVYSFYHNGSRYLYVIEFDYYDEYKFNTNSRVRGNKYEDCRFFGFREEYLESISE